MSLWMKSYGVTIQMKATEQFFPVVLFIMLYKVVLTFECVDEILWCDHSNETFLAVLSHGIMCFSVFYNRDLFGRHALPLWSFTDFNLQTRERESEAGTEARVLTSQIKSHSPHSKF